MDVVGSVSAVLTVAAAVTKLAKGLNDVRDRYNNVALTTTLVSSQLNSIRAALEAIADWRITTQDTPRSSQQLDEDLAVSLNCCAILVTVIDSKLGEAGYTPGIKQKIRHLWLEDTLKEYLSNLEGQVRSLQLLLTIFQCRTTSEQRQKLDKRESRTIIAQLRIDTISLNVDSDAVSIFSLNPSVNLEVDSILMKHPRYIEAYGKNRINHRNQSTKPDIESEHRDTLLFPGLIAKAEGPVQDYTASGVVRDDTGVESLFEDPKRPMSSKEDSSAERLLESQNGPPSIEYEASSVRSAKSRPKPIDESKVSQWAAAPPFRRLSLDLGTDEKDFGLMITSEGLGRAEFMEIQEQQQSVESKARDVDVSADVDTSLANKEQADSDVSVPINRRSPYKKHASGYLSGTPQSPHYLNRHIFCIRNSTSFIIFNHHHV